MYDLLLVEVAALSHTAGPSEEHKVAQARCIVQAGVMHKCFFPVACTPTPAANTFPRTAQWHFTLMRKGEGFFFWGGGVCKMTLPILAGLENSNNS